MSTTSFSSTRFFNPFMLWADVAFKTSDMLLSSGTVVQIRTDRIMRTALSPNADDVQEFGLMGQEKVAAVTESGAAMVNQLHTTQFALTQRALRHGLEAAEAMAAMMVSSSPAQFTAHAQKLMNAANRSATTASHLSSAAARIAQRGLKPIHSRASANARRLSSQSPA